MFPLDPEEGPPGDIHCGVPELDRVHLAQPFEAFDLHASASDLVERLKDRWDIGGFDDLGL